MRMPSMRIAEASPTPMSLRISSVLRAKAPNTDTMISAAAVITFEVRARPKVTANIITGMNGGTGRSESMPISRPAQPPSAM